MGTHLVSVGNLVSGSRGGGNDTTLLATIVSIDPIYLNFDMSEADYLDFERGRASQKAALANKVDIALADENRFESSWNFEFPRQSPRPFKRHHQRCGMRAERWFRSARSLRSRKGPRPTVCPDITSIPLPKSWVNPLREFRRERRSSVSKNSPERLFLQELRSSGRISRTSKQRRGFRRW